LPDQSRDVVGALLQGETSGPDAATVPSMVHTYSPEGRIEAREGAGPIQPGRRPETMQQQYGGPALPIRVLADPDITAALQLDATSGRRKLRYLGDWSPDQLVLHIF
jgi:hypothetical protein